MGRETYTGDVAFELRGHLGIITLNRPHAVNALTQLMCECILVQLQDWAVDDRVSQVLIRGAGDRGLCAGGDVSSLYQEMVQLQGLDGGAVLPAGAPGYEAEFTSETFLANEYALNRTIAEYPKPYVALMDGLVLGGGIGVSAHGSHRIVTERTRAGMPETTIGFAPDVGGTWLLGQAPGRLGLHAGLTGAHLDAADAITLGLADVEVPSDVLAELTQALSTELVADALPRFTRTPEASTLARSRSWIDQAYAAPNVEAALQRLDELALTEEAAAAAAESLRKKSPVSLKVAHRAILAAQELTLPQALEAEFTVAVHMLRSADFREGIRAQIIDKDRAPQWSPGTLEAVDLELVQTYFTPVPGHRLADRQSL
ncbi:3-hydroxyisobutyryl-CoA hydrolase [Nesterenkonia sp. LB17]|uniref:3-hydroxyisobutyryl-CoA hydrolase n=1 Tax=unclassified Nesterenkonia TaxID=2629769 RepID=UPI001F4CCF03|nr:MULTISPECIES: 3-hydroxyisobutyryl-CoA hydrolase [unclassified Nesterenkonia]MCH8562190.1 3-hydroxyisobutyryl-CoA hydrolase [Nesterenkonia sp. YGD6]MCH8564277.1 3-hydroxyisobutyryl-CoA hydrolase [Nesterenkonia sp. LB17]